ncbi:hypothetical protein SAY86_003096 [Trapa natans]|uniref:Methyltransferase-like protein 13 n=1 Tax=Trapa natans TaxID=22666 RepID=A0AAN7R1L5_TRANT|nr:hypothetical protein SAY86_003096 [Trapa natans]
MALDITCFETLVPSRYITFTIPNPCRESSAHSLLRVAVLDSPHHLDGSSLVAAIVVPENREGDWIFCTESGHLQLLISNTPDVSRLILVGRDMFDECDGPLILHRGSTERKNPLEEIVGPLLLALSPKICFNDGIPEVPILKYEDGVIASLTLEKCTGVFVGEMLIEDVELENDDQKFEEREFRRRLRFKRMPNLVQTQVRIISKSDVQTDIGKARFSIDSQVLVHPYLPPMVASLRLVSLHIENRLCVRMRPKALCLGIGGGALVSFLNGQLGFDVLGVEIDEEVLRVAWQYFGLKKCSKMVHIISGDAIEIVKKLSDLSVKGNSVSSHCNATCNGYSFEDPFDVIMVDLDSGDVRNGSIAPPFDFMEKSVISALRSILCPSGIVVVNVIPSSSSFYSMLISEFREVFCDLYEIDIGNNENFILIATVASVDDYNVNHGNSFMERLTSVIPCSYIDTIKKI